MNPVPCQTTLAITLLPGPFHDSVTPSTATFRSPRSASAAMVTETAAPPADQDADTHEFAGDVRVSQKPPTTEDWERVADIPVFNAKHEAVPFGSLHADPAQRTLVCFIRHFFCGVRMRRRPRPGSEQC